MKVTLIHFKQTSPLTDRKIACPMVSAPEASPWTTTAPVGAAPGHPVCREGICRVQGTSDFCSRRSMRPRPGARSRHRQFRRARGLRKSQWPMGNSHLITSRNPTCNALWKKLKRSVAFHISAQGCAKPLSSTQNLQDVSSGALSLEFFQTPLGTAPA